MAKSKHTIPLRTCCGCQSKKEAWELQRITLSPQGDLMLDGWKKAPGRGAYLCRRPECLALAVRKKSFSRVFKCAISPAALAQLQQTFQQCLNQD